MPREAFSRHNAGILRSLLLCVSALMLHASTCQSSHNRRLLAKGRSDPDGRYGEFARQVDERRATRYTLSCDATVMDEAELFCVVSEVACRGSVQAMKLP